MTSKRRQKHWSYIAGEKGRNRVRAFEVSGGRIHLEFVEHGRRKCIALGHSDRERAKQDADRLAAEFGQSLRVRESGDLTLGELFDIYLRDVTPGKGAEKQSHDRRTAGLWLEAVSASRLASDLTAADAVAFIANRKARGDLRTGRGGRSLGREIKPRSWRADLAFLKAALRWGLSEGLFSGTPGIVYFRDRTKAEVRRPILTDSDVAVFSQAALREGSACHCMFVLAHETGHRVGAIRQLRWSDLDLTGGWVRWRPELDKIGHDHTTPLSADAVAVLRARRDEAGVVFGDLPVFEAPRGPGRAISKSLVRDWWERLEQHVGLPACPGRGWHSLRRKFASDLKHRPLVDVAALGGWKDTTTILRSYQRPDQATMREALVGRRGALGEATAEGTAEGGEKSVQKKQPRLTIRRSKAVS